MRDVGCVCGMGGQAAETIATTATSDSARGEDGFHSDSARWLLRPAMETVFSARQNGPALLAVSSARALNGTDTGNGMSATSTSSAGVASNASVIELKQSLQEIQHMQRNMATAQRTIAASQQNMATHMQAMSGDQNDSCGCILS